VEGKEPKSVLLMINLHADDQSTFSIFSSMHGVIEWLDQLPVQHVSTPYPLAKTGARGVTVVDVIEFQK